MVQDRQFTKPSTEKYDLYKKNLFESEDALNYLKVERGLADATIEHFGLGFDTERNAIVIPVFKNNELINLRYRLIDPQEKQSKYIQEKDCEVWLYNEQGIDTGLKKGAVLVVEGEFDCMSAWQAGIKNTISPASGKDSYGVWLELLDPIPEVYICYDNDKPGRDASYKFAERVGIEKSKEISYPEEIKDANEYFKKYKREDFIELIKQARPFYTRKYNDLYDVINLLRADNREKVQVDIIPDVKLTQDHLLAITGSTGTGKCHGFGTRILMYDGTVKEVQDIVVGDLLMGNDSTPREVLSLARGIDEMYRVFEGEEYYDVNKSHILSLKKHGTKYIEKTVEQYLAIADSSKRHYRGWKTPVSFNGSNTELDPYYLGLWLGDGSAVDTAITTADKVIVDWLFRYAKDNGLEVKVINQKNNKSNGYRITNHIKDIGNNVIRNGLTKNNLLNNKHIPHEYKINSERMRLRLFAGIIDSDGHLSKSKWGTCYEVIQKNKVLADDIVFLCRSLGFRAVIKKCVKSIKSIGFTGEYYRIHIVGDFRRVPTLLERKKSNFVSKKNYLAHKIEIKPLGIGKYYGFTLSGNGLYLLDSFTVTHNTMYVLNIAKRLAEKDIPCLILPFERGIQVSGERFLQIISDKTEDQMKSMTSDEWDRLTKKVSKLPIYFSLPGKNELVEVLTKAKRILGVGAVIVDHLDYMIRNSGNNEESEIRSRMHELKTFAIENEVMVFVVTHPRRTKQAGSEGGKKPTLDDIRGSSSVAQDSETVIILDKSSDTELEVDVQKNKGVISKRVYPVDYNTGLMGDASKKVLTLDDF